jgi:hypothetical protein
LIIVLFLAGTWLAYSGRGWDKLNAIMRIPVIEYLAAFLMAALVGGGLWVTRHLRPRPMELVPVTREG